VNKVSGRKLSEFFFIHSLAFWSREKFEKEQSAGKRKFVPTSEKTFDPFTQFHKTFSFLLCHRQFRETASGVYFHARFLYQANV
jgi:hypothetical protein